MLIVLEGAALSQDLTLIRNESTSMDEFRRGIYRIGLHLAAETSKHLPTKSVNVSTPLETMASNVIEGEVVIVPVLRAGLGLLDSFLHFMPYARVGFEGLRRDEETLQPIEYYSKMPPSNTSTTFIIVDPMLATGGSLSATIKSLSKLPNARILASCLIAAPEGVSRVREEHPGVTLVIGALDRELNQNGYILPGLGDAGDRLFGTQ